VGKGGGRGSSNTRVTQFLHSRESNFIRIRGEYR